MKVQHTGTQLSIGLIDEGGVAPGVVVLSLLILNKNKSSITFFIISKKKKSTENNWQFTDFIFLGRNTNQKSSFKNTVVHRLNKKEEVRTGERGKSKTMWRQYDGNVFLVI